MRRVGRRRNPSAAGVPEECGRIHVSHLPQIRQAFAKMDFDFLTERGSGALARRIGRERRKVALRYLSVLQEDFQNLMRVARVIAQLSPEIAAARELERLRL